MLGVEPKRTNQDGNGELTSPTGGTPTIGYRSIGKQMFGSTAQNTGRGRVEMTMHSDSLALQQPSGQDHEDDLEVHIRVTSPPVGSRHQARHRWEHRRLLHPVPRHL
jgi:hypothetical protein